MTGPLGTPDPGPKRQRGPAAAPALAGASGWGHAGRSHWAWHLTPAGRELFGPAGPDPAALAGDVVKRNLQRTVSRAVVAGVSVFVKRSRPNTPRAWVRELLRGPKARLEFDNALALLARGVPCAEPLAWGRPASVGPAESVLVTRGLAGEPLADVLARPLTPAARRAWAGRLARLFAALHAAGVAHPDPHPGNFLADPAGPVRLIDLHAVRVGRPLGDAAAVANLVLLNRFFQMRATRTDRLRFWQAYSCGWEPPRAVRTPALRIEAETRASNRRFWLARTKRHLGDNRDTRRVSGPAAKGWAVRDLPADLVAGWLLDPDAAFRQPGAVRLKDSRTSTVARLDTPAGPVAYKRFNLKSPLLPLKSIFRRPPAVRSWLAGQGLRDRDLPTARPLACFQRHRFGLPTVGYLVCEWVPDAAELPAAVAALDEPGCRELAWELGRLVRLLLDRGLRHRDLKAANVLVSGGRPVLIDLVGVHAGRDRPHREMVRLAASLADSPLVRNSHRLRALRAALGPRGDWKPAWQAVAEAARRKVAVVKATPPAGR